VIISAAPNVLHSYYTFTIVNNKRSSHAFTYYTQVKEEHAWHMHVDSHMHSVNGIYTYA
jgi:hypothetical protein